jgi:hypothetical protein
VDNKAKKMSVLTQSPVYQAEITDSFSLQNTEITTGETDGFLAVSVCSILAFVDSGGYWSASHYEGPDSVSVEILWVFCEVVMNTDYGISTSVPVVNKISPMLHTQLFMDHRTI